MKTHIIILISAILSSCGLPFYHERKNCYISIDTKDYTDITCGSRTSRISKGQDGAQGTNGTNGEDGLSTVYSIAEAPSCKAGGSIILMAQDSDRNGVLDPTDANISSVVICNGENGTNGENGAQGEQGVAGTDGTDGANGTKGDTGAAGTNGTNGNSGSNGINGTNGTDAPISEFTLVAIIDPCGDYPGVIDEVFLKLQNGTLLASMSDNAKGKNTRFSILTEGNFVTSDGSKCYFSIDVNNNVINQHY